MRKNITISLVLMLCVVAVASCIGGKSPSVSEDDISIPPPDLLYKDSEIIWFGTTVNTVVACWPDGTVCRWDLDTGKRISHFRINNYDFSLDDNLYLFSSNRFLVAYNNNSLCLSHTSRPLIAVYNLAFGEGWNMFNKEQEKLYYDYVNAIYFYDLATGEQIKKIKFEDGVLDILGFSKDGRLFFVRTDEPLVYCFDLQTGKSIWCGHYPECDVLGTTHIRGDGMGYVAFFFSKISARDKSDKLLWQKEQIWQRDPNNIWRIQIADGQPLGPTDVVLLEEELSDWVYRFAAMSLTDGTILWEKCGIDDIRATSEDRKKQAIYLNGALHIASFPQKETIAVSEVNGLSDVIFTDGGKKLLCLPTLLSEHRGSFFADTYTVERKSHILKVIDCKTGKVVQQFELKKPAS